MSLGREEIWRRMAAQKFDDALASEILAHLLGHGSAKQKAAPPTAPLQRLFRAAVLELGRTGDVRERLVLGALVDGDRADAHRRYESLIEGPTGERVAQLRRKGALFLPADAAIALDAFERAVALAPEDGNAWLGLCLARQRTGDRRGGREAFAKASRNGADLGILDPQAPAPVRATPSPSPEALEAIRPIRAGALDAAAELFPKARDRFPRLATHFSLDEPRKWDLVAGVGVAWFAFEAIYVASPPVEFGALSGHLFEPRTRRRTFSPLPPSRVKEFDTLWERIGQEILLDCASFVATATTPLWEAAGAEGLHEREARARRTRADEADRRSVGAWVLGRMYNTSEIDEPEDRVAELGRWMKEAAGRRIES